MPVYDVPRGGRRRPLADRAARAPARTRRERTSCTRTTRLPCSTPCPLPCSPAYGGGCTPSTARTATVVVRSGRRGRSCARCDAVVAVSPRRPTSRASRSACPRDACASCRTASRSGPFIPTLTRVRACAPSSASQPDAFVVGSVGQARRREGLPAARAGACRPCSRSGSSRASSATGDARAEIERADPARSSRRYVTLTGVRRDIPAVLASFDLFALSSRTEGLPLAVPEAMASALPVVATAVGGLPSVVPATCGVLVPPGDEAALARRSGRWRATRRARGRWAIGAEPRARRASRSSGWPTHYERIYRGD